MTRGHKSHIGIGFVIDVYTGIAIDFQVLCNFCVICHRGKKLDTSVIRILMVKVEQWRQKLLCCCGRVHVNTTSDTLLSLEMATQVHFQQFVL